MRGLKKIFLNYRKQFNKFKNVLKLQLRFKKLKKLLDNFKYFLNYFKLKFLIKIYKFNVLNHKDYNVINDYV